MIIRQYLLAVVLGIACAINDAAPISVGAAMICGNEKNPSVYQNLNYGLYWFADVNNIAYCDANHNDVQFFNYKKPHTLIFVHGWSPVSVKKQKRFSFDANTLSGPNVTDMIAPWLKGSNGDHQPWNVGVFYWNQFADEFINNTDTPSLMSAVQHAEAKIWSAHSAIGMRWKNLDDQFSLPINEHDKNIVQLFYQQYVAALKDYSGDVRLVGASLGTQIIISAAKMIDDAVKSGYLNRNLLPRQIILLDPVVTDVNNSEHMKTLIAEVKQLELDGVIISGYRTSILGNTLRHTDDNSALLKYTAFSQIDPCVYSPTAFMLRHTTGIWWYFLSYNLTKVPVTNDPNESAPFANMPETQLRHLMSPTATAFRSNIVKNAFTNHECRSSNINEEWNKWEMKKISKS